MSEDVLSQEEVESLLTGLSPETKPKEAPQAATATAVAAPAPTPASAPSPRPMVAAIPYDFKRPERVGKEQMRALEALHEGFGRNFGAALSAMLRCIIDVKLTSVDQLTYSEFVFSLENPTCFNVVKASPLDGSLILDMNLSILYLIIDRLLGGGNEKDSATRRPLTDIELRLVSRITDLFLAELQKAWHNVVSLDLSVEQIESNPQLVQLVPPSEVVVVVSFELMISDVRGMINLCIPFNAIERISSKLAANSWFTAGKSSPSDESIQQLSHRLGDATMELVVTLAKTKITTSDLLELRVGDIITTEQDARGALEVNVAGVPKFAAKPGAYRGRKAFQVTRVLGSGQK